VTVGGFTKPRFPLPENFQFHQIDKNPYPKEKWSDGLIRFLNDIHDDILFYSGRLLLRRTVDLEVNLLDYMRIHTDVVRMD
jgi:hypothetical protein